MSSEPRSLKPQGRLVWDALKEGLRPREITARHGIKYDTVANYMRYWRQCGFDVPTFVDAGMGALTARMVLTFPKPVVVALIRAAETRGVTAEQLVKQLVTTVVDDKLIDGVLDDAA